MLFNGFFRDRSSSGRARRRSRRIVPRHTAAHALEVLEARLPLAFNVTTTTLTTTPPTFAYNITITDQVDANGFGRDIYLARFDSGVPLIKVADKMCNLRDLHDSPLKHWTVERRQRYRQWATDVVTALPLGGH